MKSSVWALDGQSHEKLYVLRGIHEQDHFGKVLRIFWLVTVQPIMTGVPCR